MTRPQKEKELSRSHHITLRLTDMEYELVMNRAKESGISRSNYIRIQRVGGAGVMKYEIVADIPELQKLTAEFGKIGNNLSQIAKYFNMGGIRSKSMQDEIHECISRIFEMREDVRKMAGDYHGSFETHRQ